jgi:hypothetical protein
MSYEVIKPSVYRFIRVYAYLPEVRQDRTLVKAIYLLLHLPLLQQLWHLADCFLYFPLPRQGRRSVQGSLHMLLSQEGLYSVHHRLVLSHLNARVDAPKVYLLMRRLSARERAALPSALFSEPFEKAADPRRIDT